MSRRGWYLFLMFLIISVGTYFFWRLNCEFCTATATDDNELLIEKPILDLDPEIEPVETKNDSIN